MAITITIDNDPVTAGIQTLVDDESSGLQLPGTTDTGNDSNLDITDPTVGNPDSNTFDGTLSGAGYSASFLSFLNAATIFGYGTLRLSDAQKAFAANVEGAVSSSSFVSASANAGETINDLFFSDSSGNALDGDQVVGMQTLDGSNVYLWSIGDYAIATTSSTAGAGRVVAAFYLNEAANHLSAQVQMVTFEALKHPTNPNPDDSLNFTNVLQVSAAASESFNFNSLKSGDFLWVAVGDSNAAVLVTGGNPQVGSDNKITNTSDDIHVSQGGDGTTIGINNQLFDGSGETGVFTLVKGLSTLPGGTNGAGGSYTVDPNTHDNKLEGIDYSDYINVSGAGIYISQSQGTPSVGKDFEVKLLKAGPSIEDLTNYIPGLTSDGSVNVGTVTIKADDGHVVGTWGTGGLASGAAVDYTSPNGAAHVSVTISGNTIDVHGVLGNYTVDWTAASGTFNRFDLTWLAGKFDVGRVDVVEASGNSVGVGGDLIVQDDGPTVAPTLVANATVSVDESAPSTVPTLNTGAIVKGVDPDNPDTAGGNALGFGTSGSAVVDPHAVFGTDGPAAGGGVTYALSILGVSSGLTLTDGSAINLQLVSGVIVGVVSGGAFNGKAAFAIAINSTTGVVTVEQYLSLHHNSADTNGDSDESVQANLNTIGVTVTATDGDGDPKTSTAVDISHQISFHDDGPAVAPTLNANATVSVDESAPSTVPSIDTGAIIKGVDPDNPDTVGGNALGAGTSGSAVVAPHAVFGADGAAAGGGISYALSLGNVTSGLTLTDGTAINLQQLANGNIVGVVASGTFSGKAAFAISINSTTGVVTVEQYLSLHHDSADSNGDSDEAVQANLNTIGVTVTATDGDSDSITSSAVDISHQISFHDDGPTITASSTGAPTITDDESNFAIDNFASYAAQFTKAYGADGPAATPVTYAISATASADSGLVESGTGNHVFLFNESGVVVGRAGTTAITAASGDIVFTATVDSTGKVTLDQRIAVVHTPNVNANDVTTLSSAGLVVVTATAYDGDGDSKSTGLNIGTLLQFQDDAPTILSQILDGTVQFANDATGTVTHSLNGSIGADGTSSTQTSLSGTAEYTITYSDTTPTNVFANLNPVLSANGTVLTYYSDLADTNAVYRLTLDPTANGGQGSYTFAVLQPPPLITNHFNFLDLPSGQNLQATIAQNKANIDTHGTGTTTDDTLPDGGILVFPTNPVLKADGTYDNTSGTINTSQGGGNVTIGNGNQAFDNPGDGAWFMFVDNPLKSDVGGFPSGAGGLDQTTADDADTIGFNGTNQSLDSSVKIVQASGKGTVQSPGPALHITTYEADPGHVDTSTESRNLVNDPTSAASNQGTAAPEVNITGIKIHDSTGAVIEYRTNPETGASNFGTLVGADSPVGIQFIRDVNSDPLNPIYSAVISNLQANYTVEFLTETNHNLAKVEWVSGSFDIGGFDITNRANVPAQDFHFAVTITDYDNDAYGGHLATFADFNVHIDGAIFS